MPVKIYLKAARQPHDLFYMPGNNITSYGEISRIKLILQISKYYTLITEIVQK